MPVFGELEIEIPAKLLELTVNDLGASQGMRLGGQRRRNMWAAHVGGSRSGHWDGHGRSMIAIAWQFITAYLKVGASGSVN